MHDFDTRLRAEIMHTLVFFTKNHAYHHKRYRGFLKIMHIFDFDAGKTIEWIRTCLYDRNDKSVFYNFDMGDPIMM